MRSHEATSWERKAIALRMAAGCSRLGDLERWVSTRGELAAASRVRSQRSAEPVPPARPGEVGEWTAASTWVSLEKQASGYCAEREGPPGRRGGCAPCLGSSNSNAPARVLSRVARAGSSVRTRGSAFPIAANSKSRALGRRPLDSSGLELRRRRRSTLGDVANEARCAGPASALYEHPAQALDVLQRVARRGVL